MYKINKSNQTRYGDKMENNMNLYEKIAIKNTPNENKLKNASLAFLSGGLIGALAEGMIVVYGYYLNIPRKDSGVLALLTLIVLASLFTGLGFFDSLVLKFKAGLFVPITGFAHAMTSSAMEYRKEGLVLGIGSNIFKLSGSVILYGIVSAYVFGTIRLIIEGVFG